MKFLFSFSVLACCVVLLHGLEVRGSALVPHAPFVPKVGDAVSKALGIVQRYDWHELKGFMDELGQEIDAIDSDAVATILQKKVVGQQLKRWAADQVLSLIAIQDIVAEHTEDDNLLQLWNKNPHSPTENLIVKIGFPLLVPPQWERKYFNERESLLAKFAGLPPMQQAVIINIIWGSTENARRFGSIHHIGSIHVGVASDYFLKIREQAAEAYYSDQHALEMQLQQQEMRQRLHTLLSFDMRESMPATAALTNEDFRIDDAHSFQYFHHVSLVEQLAVEGVMQAVAAGFPQLARTISQLTEEQIAYLTANLPYNDDIEEGYIPERGTAIAVTQDLKYYAAVHFFVWAGIGMDYAKTDARVRAVLRD